MQVSDVNFQTQLVTSSQKISSLIRTKNRLESRTTRVITMIFVCAATPILSLGCRVSTSISPDALWSAIVVSLVVGFYLFIYGYRDVKGMGFENQIGHDLLGLMKAAALEETLAPEIQKKWDGILTKYAPLLPSLILDWKKDFVDNTWSPMALKRFFSYFHHCKCLEVLTLLNFPYDMKEILQELSKLQIGTLNLSGSQVTDQALNEVQFNGLEGLVLRNCTRLTTTGLKQFGEQNPSLTSLDTCYTCPSQGLDFLSSFPSLRALTLTELGDNSVQSLTQLASLSVLTIPSSPTLTGETLFQLNGNLKLQEIRIGECKKFTPRGVSTIENLPSLKRIVFTVALESIVESARGFAAVRRSLREKFTAPPDAFIIDALIGIWQKRTNKRKEILI